MNKESIETAKKIYSHLERWKLANRTLTDFFSKNSSNKSEEVVLTKVVLIDSLYKTNLRDQISVAKHIWGLDFLDKLLIDGNFAAVEKVAKCENKNLLSFASKFCHFHNKQDYPIYDKYVRIALKKLTNWKDDRTYSGFKQAINDFRRRNKIENTSFEDLDKYLWLVGLMERLRENKTDVNREIYQFYIENKVLFENL